MPDNSYYTAPLSKNQILTLYANLAPLHFPADELRPMENMESLFAREGYEGLGLYHTAAPDKLLGYALFIHVPKLPIVLLDFYAILEEYRCLGLGSTFLQQIKIHYQNIRGILLETEDVAAASSPEEKLLRERRNSFYEKNGAGKTSLSSTVFGVAYSIYFLPTQTATTSVSKLLSKTSHTDFFYEALEKIYRFMLPDKLYQHVSISKH